MTPQVRHRAIGLEAVHATRARLRRDEPALRAAIDTTVREEYERALTLAKQQLGPVLPGQRTPLPLADVTAGGRWQDTPLIKSRLAGGYCLRTAAQGACAYANICEHCPNFRNDPGFLPILAAQRADAQALAADAHARDWISEASRHRKLVEQLDLLMSRICPAPCTT